MHRIIAVLSLAAVAASVPALTDDQSKPNRQFSPPAEGQQCAAFEDYCLEFLNFERENDYVTARFRLTNSSQSNVTVTETSNGTVLMELHNLQASEWVRVDGLPCGNGLRSRSVSPGEAIIISDGLVDLSSRLQPTRNVRSDIFRGVVRLRRSHDRSIAYVTSIVLPPLPRAWIQQRDLLSN